MSKYSCEALGHNTVRAKSSDIFCIECGSVGKISSTSKEQMRFEAACAAMTGWIAHYGMSNISGDVNIKKHNKIAINCRKLADALIAELEKGKDE